MSQVRQAKTGYFDTLIFDKKGTTTILRAVNLGKKTTAPPTQLSAEELNNHCISLADKMKVFIADTYSPGTDNCFEQLNDICQRNKVDKEAFIIPPIAVYEVEQCGKNLENKKSMSPDKLPVKLLKLSPTVYCGFTHVRV